MIRLRKSKPKRNRNFEPYGTVDKQDNIIVILRMTLIRLEMKKKNKLICLQKQRT